MLLKINNSKSEIDISLKSFFDFGLLHINAVGYDFFCLIENTSIDNLDFSYYILNNIIIMYFQMYCVY